MPLRRAYDGEKTVTTLRDAYLDRLARWSDIQEYMPFLHDQARSRVSPAILELGARRGNSTLAFLAGTQENGGHVWSSDIDNILRYPDGMRAWRDTPHWTFVCGDDMDPAVQAALPAAVDVLFLDTSHEYDHTLAELRAYVPRVKPGGIALFHDTRLMRWPGYDWHGDVAPVWQALDDYCAETGRAWENREGRYGLGVIKVA